MLPHTQNAHRAVRQPREVIPAHRLPLLVGESAVPTLIARAPEPSPSQGTTCQGGNRCQKSTSTLTTTTLPVVLGAGVPIVCAIVVLIILHRRHVRKLMREDAMDKHKSLDFGLDMVEPKGGNGGGRGRMPRSGHGKGMSLDVSPYLMPPGLHSSRDSLHSMSRSIPDDDKYHPAAMFTHDNGSMRSVSRGAREDNASVAGSTSRFGTGEEPNSGLLRNAQRMSRSSPPLQSVSPSVSERKTASPPQDYLGTIPGLNAVSHADSHDLGSATTDYGEHSQNNDRDASYPEPRHPSIPTPSIQLEAEVDVHRTASSDFSFDKRPNFPLPDSAPYPSDDGHEQSSTMQLPRISLPSSEVTSDYGDERKSEFMTPALNIHEAEDDEEHHSVELDDAINIPEMPEDPQNLDLAYDNRLDTRRLTMGLRPLPPEDPSDNPEQRANRIRSFYKEYFDETKRETQYFDEEDYEPEYYEDAGYIYDPATGEYFDAFPPAPAPYAEPPPRRAMTPPPRAPPRFQGGSRHMATNSAGFNGFVPGPRAFSSASGRLPGARGPRKPMPPPSPLRNLPTPHLLTDDSIFMAADFAPGKNFRDQREGRPETPTGGLRAFSPMTRAHTPLASPFDELSVMPSPYALRKSGTFTNLDFAPPPRFKNTSDSGSDAGSIRSNRTGISTTHMNNIRMGAYRVSRLPSEMVGTKDDLASTLRPKWDMRNV